MSEEKKEGGCCSEKEGSCGSGGGRCCAGKALGLLALLLVVGLIGFMMGKCRGGKMGACPMSSMTTSAPAVPAK